MYCRHYQLHAGVLVLPHDLQLLSYDHSNRPCAADVRRLNFPDIYRIMTFFEWQKTVVSITFSRKSALGIMSRQYVVQFQLGTTRLLRFIDFLLAVERTQQIMDSTTLYCIVSCHSKWRIRRIFPYISVLDDVTTQGLLLLKFQHLSRIEFTKLIFNCNENYNHLWTTSYTTASQVILLINLK